MAKASKTEKTAEKTTQEEFKPANLPLFFKRPMIIEKERHKNAYLSQTSDIGFARQTNSVPLSALEFIEAAKHYPIVFTSDDQCIPVAVLGWEQENYFVDAQGAWEKSAYVPAYIRQYPFIFVQNESTDTFLLAVDEEADNFHTSPVGDAEPLFENGEASNLSKRALEFCSAFYQNMNITRNLCADLKAHNLLAPYTSKASLDDGREMQLNGFLMIDEKAFNELSDETFLEFRKKGWLAFIYLALASAANWKTLMEHALVRPKVPDDIRKN